MKCNTEIGSNSQYTCSRKKSFTIFLIYLKNKWIASSYWLIFFLQFHLPAVNVVLLFFEWKIQTQFGLKISLSLFIEQREE